ncbi:MAG: hypothetical protein M3Q79_03960 [bacterium]|nr:hypothetical protein [bacterium]
MTNLDPALNEQERARYYTGLSDSITPSEVPSMLLPIYRFARENSGAFVRSLSESESPEAGMLGFATRALKRVAHFRPGGEDEFYKGWLDLSPTRKLERAKELAPVSTENLLDLEDIRDPAILIFSRLEAAYRKTVSDPSSKNLIHAVDTNIAPHGRVIKVGLFLGYEALLTSIHGDQDLSHFNRFSFQEHEGVA